MATTLPGINIAIGIDDTRFRSNLRRVQRDFETVATTSTRATGQMRAGFQNAAFQIQDFVVQVSSGTSAMRAFSQQAPQLLGAFGPGGAAIGVVVAIVGALGASFLTAGKNAAAAAGDMDKFKVSLDTLVGSVDEAKKSFREMGAAQREALSGQLVEQFFQAETALDGIEKQLRDTAVAFGQVGAAEAGLEKGTGALSNLIADLQAGLIAPQRFAAEVRDLADVVGNTDLDEFASEVGKLGREFAETELGMEQARRRIQALDQIATGHTRTQEELAEGVKGWRVQLAAWEKSARGAADAVGKLTDKQKRLQQAGATVHRTSAGEERFADQAKREAAIAAEIKATMDKQAEAAAASAKQLSTPFEQPRPEAQAATVEAFRLAFAV